MNAQQIKELVANKEQLIALKKATIKHCDPISFDNSSEVTSKAFSYASNDELDKGIIKRVIVGNTYNWMDSHDDVHLPGVFTKSLKQNKAKVMHLHDHEYKLTAKVGEPIDVFEQNINWLDLGVNKVGETTALMMYSAIKEKYNHFIFSQYIDKLINQHSVGMVYIKIDLAVNDPQYKEEIEIWNRYINQIANKERAIERNHFWAVSEAKLIEISAVISGSNELTPTLEPSQDIQEPEPLKGIQEGIDYNYLLKNIKIFS